MKKMIRVFCAALALCLTLAGCRAFHDHTWSFDYKRHWSDCECGAQIEPAAHTLHENICIGCGAKILSFDDGGYVQTYDEHGSIKTSAEYSSYGDLIREDRYDWEYDENGSPTHLQIYSDGVLSEEMTYQPCVIPGQEVCLKERSDYSEDGSRRVISYDAYGSMLSDTVYDPDGTVDLQSTYDNAYDDQGNRLRQTCCTDGVLSKETLSFLGPDGILYDSSIISYNADGSIARDDIYVHEFDDQGNLCYRSRSIGGMRTDERFYKLDPDGGVYLAHEICYRDNGTKSEEFIHELNASGRDYLSRHIEYGEDGSITAERRYDDLGNKIE